jgi:NAD(P)H-flavin reductase
METGMYTPVEAVIDAIRQETPSIKTFTLRPKNPCSFKTGQFIELTIPGIGEAPFTPSSDPDVKQTFDITVMNAGTVTAALHAAVVGDVVGIRGPYGKGYPLNEMKGRDILIVGGGVGLAPLRSLILSLLRGRGDYKKIFLRYGARTPDDIVYRDTVAQWSKTKGFDCAVTVDTAPSSWEGRRGVVTTILSGLQVDMPTVHALVCGPPVMMKFVTYKLLEEGCKPENVYLSMEKNMSCGLGKCGHCRLGRFYACKDGPVFAYEQLKDVWDIWD